MVSNRYVSRTFYLQLYYLQGTFLQLMVDSSAKTILRGTASVCSQVTHTL